jgi:hypothetical protein
MGVMLRCGKGGRRRQERMEINRHKPTLTLTFMA